MASPFGLAIFSAGLVGILIGLLVSLLVSVLVSLLVGLLILAVAVVFHVNHLPVSRLVCPESER